MRVRVLSASRKTILFGSAFAAKEEMPLAVN
jgi:hypothetical protein